jgi:agmatine deiminase
MTVYVSKALAREFPNVFSALSFPDGCMELDSDNLWARDYMPVKTGDGFTKFKYKGYLYDQLEVQDDCWQWTNPKLSGIFLDGGNVEQNDTTALMTEIVFRNNPDIAKDGLIQLLQDMFQKKIVFIPVEPGDDLGHIDGIARFIDDKTVFINDYRVWDNQTWVSYAERLEKVLTGNGINFVRFPWVYKKMPIMTQREFREKYPYADDFNPGFGYYINYFHSGDTIFVPHFDIEEDRAAMMILAEHFPQHSIVPVDCRDLSMLGGLCNCVTWND